MRENKVNKDTKGKVELTGNLAEFRMALEEEIEQIKKSGQSSTLLSGGRQIRNNDSDLWYQFQAEYIPAMPADTPCKLVVNKEQFDVTVISFDEKTVVVAAKSPLPDTLEKARLENGSTVLMERLIQCIEKNAEVTNKAGLRMFRQGEEVYKSQTIKAYEDSDFSLKSSNNGGQNRAIKAALSNDITYIWGPPGTGKTTVIGQIIYNLYRNNRSVLVVSHTNTAVDGAIKKAYDFCWEGHKKGDVCPVLRLGTSVKELPEEVSLNSHIKTLGSELTEQKAKLENYQRAIHKCINNDILPVLAKASWVKESHLGTIARILQAVGHCQQQRREIQNEVKAREDGLQQRKQSFPEYLECSALADSCGKTKKKISEISAYISKKESLATELSQRLQYALDEARKHDVYTSLKAREATYMSVSFLKNEQIKAQQRSFACEEEIASLKLQQQEAQETISDYEKRNRLAKLFASKTAITQAQATLQNIEVQLPRAEEDLQKYNRLEQEYERQLEELLLLQEQIRAVQPTRTKDAWVQQAEHLRKELADAQKSLSEAMAQKKMLSSTLTALEQRMANTRPAFDAVKQAEQELEQARSKLGKVNAELLREQNLCAAQLERECSLCAVFHVPQTESNLSALYNELSELLKATKEELKETNVGALEREKERLEKELEKISRQLDEIKKRLQELEKLAIWGAKIVGTTLAKSYLSETLRARTFDTVIVDEASMASIPALWCAAYLAENSIVIAGDFLQLPPIVIANTPMAKKWLGTDIFWHSGMQEEARKNRLHPEKLPPNFIALQEQFRMESDIANLANIYYKKYLKSGLSTQDKTEKRIEERKKFYEWYPGKKTKSSIHLIDTESLHAWVTGVPQGRKHSRLNCFSAAVDVDLAFKFIENKVNCLNPEPAETPAVLIVAPYKPHVTRINQLIDLEYKNRGFKENLDLIRAGTIHSFQGSEADIVIFDLVIDEPHWRANLFMTDQEVSDDLKKMFNVAITRARFKLFVVGNFAYCQKRAKGNALAELLEELLEKRHLVKEDAKSLLPDIVFEKSSAFSADGSLSGRHIVCRETAFNDYFMADIRTFKRRMIIYSPFITENRLSSLLPAFEDASSAGKQIIVVTKALSDRGKREYAQYQKCEEALRKHGVTILHKKDMHEKLIFVDSKAVWIGSLNALSFTGFTGEVMERHEDAALTAKYEELFDIDHIYEAVEHSYEQKCPLCGEEMVIRESAEGGIYWKCSSCDYSRNAAQQYPVDGILRCGKCGAPYVFTMKNEPRWVCRENAKHFQKVRAGDLRLKKMLALIPAEERIKVEQFFAQKRKEREEKDSPKR